MTDERRTDELSSDFEALRAQLERPGAVPDFDAMMGRVEADLRRPTGESTPSHRAWRRWLPLAAAAALAGILLARPGATDADAEFERLVSDYSELMAGGAWRSPTAPLLDVPGLDLGAVPSFAGYASTPSEGRNP